MRVETNTKLVQRNKRNANILFFFSMGLIILAFIGNTQVINVRDEATLGLVSLGLWLVLPISLISTFTSIRMTNMWVRRPRPEEVIQTGLKGISKRSVLYNYYHIPARHVLIAPQGVFAIVTRYQEGKHRVEGDKWGGRAGMGAVFGRLLRWDMLGNPNDDAGQAVAHVKALLAKGGAPDVDVQPLIVFTDPRAQVEMINPTIPVLYASTEKEPNLSEYMRELAQKLSEEQAQPVDKKKPGTKAKGTEVKREAGIDIEQIADALEEATIVVV